MVMELTMTDRIQSYWRWMKANPLISIVAVVIAIVLIWLAILGISCLFTGSMMDINISDALGRNVGVGTPLDFDVIRPEG